MRSLPVLLSLVLPLTATAAEGCKRLPVDPEFPAGLAGQYEVVGKAPGNGAAYTGKLTIELGKNTYLLSRNIPGQSVSGVAWLQECGMDRIRTLTVRYDGQGAPIHAACSLAGDGDNYYRATCRTRQGSKSGLEAWFQQP